MSRTLTQYPSYRKAPTVLVGVDIGKKTNVATMLNEQAQRIGGLSFSNRQADYNLFVAWLDKACEQQKASSVLVGMEPTSYLWKPLAAHLEKHQQRYCLVNAYTVKKYREGMQLDRAKDDKRDSYFIADLLRIGRYTQTQRLQGIYAELREYSALHERLRKTESRLKTQIHSLVGLVFPELTEVFSSLTAQTAMALLLHHAAAKHICTLSESEFITRVRSDFAGKRLQVTKLYQAYRLAQTSIGLAETQALQLAIRCYLQQLVTNRTHLLEAHKAFIDTFLRLPYAPYMLSMNLGLITTAHIASEIGDPKRYRQAKQWVKLAGIQPSPNHSGQKTNGLSAMSKKGRPRLRTCLYFACLRLVQQDEAFAHYYRSLKQRSTNPLTSLQAIGVLMNKVLHIQWALIRQQTSYDPAYWQMHWA